MIQFPLTAETRLMASAYEPLDADTVSALSCARSILIHATICGSDSRIKHREHHSLCFSASKCHVAPPSSRSVREFAAILLHFYQGMVKSVSAR